MADPLASARASLGHGKRRIQELETEILSFKENCYTVVIEPDADGPYDVFKLRLIKHIPDWSGPVADVLNALRSALDHLGFACSAKVGKPEKRVKSAFPFSEKLADARSNAADIRDEIRDYWIGLKPDRGKYPVLWSLNELCNISKHRHVLVDLCPIGVPSFTGAGKSVARFYFEHFAPTVFRSLGDEIKVLALHRGHSQPKLTLTFDVAIYETDVFGPEPVALVELLHDMAEIVEAIIEDIWLRSRALGVFP